MNKWIIILSIVFVVGVLVVFLSLFTYQCGRVATTRENIKLYHAILSFHGEKLEPVFYEFSKARYYHFIRWAPKAALLPAYLSEADLVRAGALTR